MEEIQKRKQEIRELLEDEEVTIETIETLEKELEELKKQEEEINKQLEELKEEKSEEETEEEETEEEETEEEAQEKIVEEKKKLIEKLEKKSMDFTEVKEEEEMKFTIESPEYRKAWAKTLMKVELDEVEKKALGDAVGTTATTFTESTSSVQGINNAGLFIPTGVRTDILEIIEEMSPFYRDIRKLAVAGNVNLPYLHEADDAEWQVELTDTKNEGQEFKQIQLTGHELAKNVVVTWKVEKMAVNEFINFITQEIAQKMGRALVSGVLYGNGTNKATGALNGLNAVSGDDPIQAIFEAYESLDNEFRIGAKAYISTGANIDLVGFQDKNDNYPFLQGLGSTKLLSIEVDPFLKNDDILVGNPNNYVLNTVEPISIVRDVNVVGRKTVYGSYGIFDGKPVSGAFAKGAYTLPSA